MIRPSAVAVMGSAKVITDVFPASILFSDQLNSAKGRRVMKIPRAAIRARLLRSAETAENADGRSQKGAKLAMAIREP